MIVCCGFDACGTCELLFLAGITQATTVRRKANCFNLLHQERLLAKMMKDKSSGLEA